MHARISTDISAAARILRNGGVVAFPTETVYGLGANGLDVNAVARVFEAKGRPHFDPLIVHVATQDAVSDLVMDFPEPAVALAARFWPGPLTLVLPRSSSVPDLVTAGLETVGVRVPDHPVARKLLRSSGVPIAAPSANLFGRVSPTTAEHVAEQLGSRIDLILDGGPCRVGVESTVVSVIDSPPSVLRPGGVSIEDLESVVGSVSQRWRDAAGKTSSPAPGMLSQHYATRTQLIVVDEFSRAPRGRQVAALALSPIENREDYGEVEVLSDASDLRVAAANLFAAMRRLDRSDADLIVAQRMPDEGLGRAMNDRLYRAAATFSQGDTSPPDP